MNCSQPAQRKNYLRNGAGCGQGCAGLDFIWPFPSWRLWGQDPGFATPFFVSLFRGVFSFFSLSLFVVLCCFFSFFFFPCRIKCGAAKGEKQEREEKKTQQRRDGQSSGQSTVL